LKKKLELKAGLPAAEPAEGVVSPKPVKKRGSRR